MEDSMTAKKRILIVFCIFISLLIFSDDSIKESSLEFNSLKCPEEIVIPHMQQKKDYENINARCKLNYIYRGRIMAVGSFDDIASIYYICRDHYIYAKIKYFDKNKKVLMEISKPEQERIIRVGLPTEMGFGVSAAFKEKEIYIAELYFLLSSPLNEKKIYGLLKRKKIDEIHIEIDKVIVDWMYHYTEKKKGYYKDGYLNRVEIEKKGKFEFKVGKKISIKVKYENKIDLKSGRKK